MLTITIIRKRCYLYVLNTVTTDFAGMSTVDCVFASCSVRLSLADVVYVLTVDNVPPFFTSEVIAMLLLL